MSQKQERVEIEGHWYTMIDMFPEDGAYGALMGFVDDFNQYFCPLAKIDSMFEGAGGSSERLDRGRGKKRERL